MAIMAPNSATAAYTMLFTKRVAGFVIEEKKVARMEYLAKRSLISSNCF